MILLGINSGCLYRKTISSHALHTHLQNSLNVNALIANVLIHLMKSTTLSNPAKFALRFADEVKTIYISRLETYHLYNPTL